MMLDEVVFVSDNIALVQYQDSISLEPPKELYETFELLVVQSKPIIDDQFTDIKLLFGSWVKSGDEDKQLEELYKSRLIPSAHLNE